MDQLFQYSRTAERGDKRRHENRCRGLSQAEAKRYYDEMTKNPYINALAAGAYIVFVVIVMNTIIEGNQGPDTILIPMAMLSLFVLSASVMGYIFFFQPVQLYLDGSKKVAVDLFLRTVGTFAGITVLLLIIMVLATGRI